MKKSPMADAIQAAWACALALGYLDPETVEVEPSATDSEMWQACMTISNNDFQFGHGDTPETAVTDMLSHMVAELETKEMNIRDAMKFFDENCLWDDLKTSYRRAKAKP